MEAVVAAVSEVVALPAYREAALAWAPAAARRDPGPVGVFLGYDFHLTADGPRLIEINTNAGGALLHGVAPPLEAAVVAMFQEEWRRAGTGRPLRTVAIVDDEPSNQFLYPEFLRFQELFARHGLEALIGAPQALRLEGDRLWLEGRPVDLVYNRLTDFTLEEPAHEALQRAYLDGAAVLTPHPHAHALYADKRNLALLGEGERLTAWGVAPQAAALLVRAVPPTRPVAEADADRLWRERDRWFFKPARGYGSKGAYRGGKLTRRVWGEILAGDYVAQQRVPPARVPGPYGELKFDLRLYVYAGRVLHRLARLYRGQTTNLRTPGGGFAEVVEAGGVNGTTVDCGISRHRAV
ncbi:hypothetical protein JCM17961_32350 [Endothiovibrio diazotrophicus]